MIGLTEEYAIEQINKKVKDLNENFGRSLEFLGFKNGWITCKKTILLFKCHLHNKIVESNYDQFIRRGSTSCEKCRREKAALKKSKYNSKEKMILAINNKIEEENSKNGRSLEFLGFVDDNFKGFSIQEIHIIIKCTKHNIIGHPSIDHFLSKGFMCKYCVSEYNSERNKISNEDLLKRLDDKYQGKYDFSSILKEKQIGSDNSRLITAVCPIHCEFTLSLQHFIKNDVVCPECYKEIQKENARKIALKTIEDVIIRRKEDFGLDISFLGFKNNEWVGYNDTILILRCNIHNEIWETTRYCNFITGSSICGCPACRNKEENQCYKIIKNLGFSSPIKRQHIIHIFDEHLGRIRDLKVDFYLPEFNIIIEYDGEQHYKFVERYHKTEEGYKNQIRRDLLVTKFCEENNLKLLRITFKEKKENIGVIVKTFVETGKDSSIKLVPRPFHNN